MRHQKKGKSLGRTKAPREALLKNLATNLLIYEKITTTEAKAKATRPLVEKIITLGKKDTLANRRQALKKLTGEKTVKKLFEAIGPKYRSRPGGYTRITKLPPRKSDGARMACLELVEDKNNS